MKRFISVFSVGLFLFFLSQPTVVLANSSKKSSGNYLLEYHYEFTNPSLQTVRLIHVHGLSLLPDPSVYYALVEQSIDGTVEVVDGMSFFKKEWEDVEGKTAVKLKNTYELQLNTVQHSIDINQVKPLTDKNTLSKYLASEPNIEPQYTLIRETAERIAGSESNPYIKAKRLFEFVAIQMKYNLESPIKNTSSVNAINDLQKAGTSMQQGGVCYDYAALYAAMLRSQGIPARVISGFKITPMDISDLKKYKRIDIIYNLHAWVEFYLEPYGWVFADPTMDSSINTANIFQNFAQTNNLYIKKGYNLPFDILQYSITSNTKTNINVRQSAILKRSPSFVAPDTEDIPSNGEQETPVKNEKESNKEKPIDIQPVLNVRKETVQQIKEYQKARKEWHEANKETPSQETEKPNKEPEKKQNGDQTTGPSSEHQEAKPSLWQRILDFFKMIFQKLFKE